LLVDIAQHLLSVLLLRLEQRRERVEESLVVARRQQTAFDAELFHRPGEAEAVH